MICCLVTLAVRAKPDSKNGIFLRSRAHGRECWKVPAILDDRGRARTIERILETDRIMGIERRNEFKFQPVLDWLDFGCKVRSECGCASSGIPACRAADLQDRFVLFTVMLCSGAGGRPLRHSLPIIRQPAIKINSLAAASLNARLGIDIFRK